MEYTKTSGVGGAWVKAADIISGTKCKLVSETTPQPSEFGSQDIAKIRFQGEAGEAKNVRINKPSINGLIDAFGTDSKKWVGEVLTAHTEKMVVSGKRVTGLYLVPDGYEVGEDAGGYIVVRKIDTSKITSEGKPVPFAEDDINPEDIPF